MEVTLSSQTFTSHHGASGVQQCDTFSQIEHQTKKDAIVQRTSFFGILSIGYSDQSVLGALFFCSPLILNPASFTGTVSNLASIYNSYNNDFLPLHQTQLVMSCYTPWLGVVCRGTLPALLALLALVALASLVLVALASLVLVVRVVGRRRTRSMGSYSRPSGLILCFSIPVVARVGLLGL